MNPSNLPPGVRDSDIPGNTPEDKAWDDFMEWAHDEMLHLSIDEARLAVLIGCAAVEIEANNSGKMIDAGVKPRLQDMEDEAAFAEQSRVEGP